jgi:hypothetical protein
VPGRQLLQPVPQLLGQRRGGEEPEPEAVEEGPGELGVLLQQRQQRGVAGRHVEVHRRPDVEEVARGPADERRRGAPVVDPEAATPGEHQVHVVVAAEGVAPRQPVQQHRRLDVEERPDLAQLLLVGREHAVGVDHTLRRSGGAGGEEDLRDAVGPERGAPAVDLVGGGRAEVLGGRLAVPGEDRAPLRHGRDRGGERGVLRDDQTRVDEVGHRAQFRVVGALQGVGDAGGHDRGADRERGQRDGEVQSAVPREDHHRPVGEAAVEEPLGQPVGPPAHLAPADGHPSAVGTSLGDQHPVGMGLAVPAEVVDDADRELTERLGGPDQQPPVRAGPGRDPWRGERAAGLGGRRHRSATSPRPPGGTATSA